MSCTCRVDRPLRTYRICTYPCLRRGNMTYSCTAARPLQGRSRVVTEKGSARQASELASGPPFYGFPRGVISPSSHFPGCDQMPTKRRTRQSLPKLYSIIRECQDFQDQRNRFLFRSDVRNPPLVLAGGRTMAETCFEIPRIDGPLSTRIFERGGFDLELTSSYSCAG